MNPYNTMKTKSWRRRKLGQLNPYNKGYVIIFFVLRMIKRKCLLTKKLSEGCIYIYMIIIQEIIVLYLQCSPLMMPFAHFSYLWNIHEKCRCFFGREDHLFLWAIFHWLPASYVAMFKNHSLQMGISTHRLSPWIFCSKIRISTGSIYSIISDQIWSRPNPVLPSPGNHSFWREITSFYGRTILVSELL